MSLFDSVLTDCTNDVSHLYNVVFPSKICRACLLIDENVNYMEMKRIYEVFSNFIGIEIDRGDLENNWLCEECFNQLSVLHTFRSSVKKADDYLKSIVDNWWTNNYNGHTNIANTDTLKLFSEARKILTSSKRRKSNCSTGTPLVKDTLDVEYNIKEESPDDKPVNVKLEQIMVIADAPSDDSNSLVANECVESPPSKRKSRTFKRQSDEPLSPSDDSGDDVLSGNFEEHLDEKFILTKILRSDALKEFKETAKSKQYLSADHKCTSCFKIFADQSSLWNHFKCHDESKGKYECFFCLIPFNDMKKLRDHEDTHMRRYKCMKCGFLAMNKTLVLKHYALSHLGKKIEFECPTCHKSYMRRSSQKNHVCMMQKVKCDECGRSMSRKTYANHMLTKHPEEGELVYECEICCDPFASTEHLQLHMQSKHHKQPDEPLYCIDCGISFPTKHGLHKHLTYTKKHADAIVLKPCPKCPNKFPFWTLDSHINKEHLKIKKYQCEMCPNSYFSKYSLAGHIQTNHNKAKKDEHMCETCGKIFKQRRHLLNHLNIHTGERPFKCHLCPKTFKQEASLFGHNQWVHLKIGKKKREERKRRKLESQTMEQKSPNTVESTQVT